MTDFFEQAVGYLAFLAVIGLCAAIIGGVVP
jgi:hypothetical protein